MYYFSRNNWKVNREKNNNIYYSLKLKLLHLLRNIERIPHESISLASCTRRREIEGYRKGRGGHRWEISQAKEAGRSTAVTIKRTRETEKYGIVWEGNAAIKLLLSLSLSARDQILKISTRCSAESRSPRSVVDRKETR